MHGIIPTDLSPPSQFSLKAEEEVLPMAEALIASLLLEKEPEERKELAFFALKNQWLLSDLADRGLSFYLHLLSLLSSFEKVSIDWPNLTLESVWEKELPPLSSLKRLLTFLLVSSLTGTSLSESFFVSLRRYFASCDHTGAPFLFYKGDEGREKSREIAQYHALLVQTVRGSLLLEGELPSSTFFQAFARNLALLRRVPLEGNFLLKGTPSPFFLSKQGSSSIAIAPSGEGGGLGAFHLNRLRLLNFGPHEGALDDFSRFGIDLHREGVFDKGWLRARGGNWFSFTPNCGDGELSLKIDFTGKSTPHFIFFFTADEARLEGGKNAIRKRGFQSYRGRAVPLSFQLGDEILQIEPWQAGEMELIPLSGEQDFWGADFYLSYDLSPRRSSYGWRISR